MNDIIIVSRSIEFLIEKAYKFIGFVSDDEKKKIMLIILRDWNENFQTVKCIVDIEKASNEDQLFYPTFERMLTMMLTPYVKPLTSDRLQTLLTDGFELKNKEEVYNFGKQFGEGVLNNFGAFRYLQLLHNYQHGPLHMVYLYINNLLHEHDIVALQMITLIIEKTDIYEYFTKNFFAYSSEISGFLLEGKDLQEDERFKEKLIVIEDYISLINYLMNDELCYISSQIGKKHEDISNDPEFNDRSYKIIRKLLINLMAGSYWTTFKEVKLSLRNLIKDSNHIESIISEISDVDPNNLKIRLKDQFLKEFDPYFFYKTRAFQKNIVYAFANKSKDSKTDVVSGQFYTDLPEYLYDIQIRFFSSSLLTSLKNFIVN